MNKFRGNTGYKNGGGYANASTRAADRAASERKPDIRPLAQDVADRADTQITVKATAAAPVDPRPDDSVALPN